MYVMDSLPTITTQVNEQCPARQMDTPDHGCPDTTHRQSPHRSELARRRPGKGACMTAAERKSRLAEIRLCLVLLGCQAGNVFEVRALDVLIGRNYRGIVSGYYDDLDRAAADILSLEERGAAGIYVTINQCDPALLARRNNRIEDRPKETTKDEHIIRRRWLPIDIDPTRGQTGVSGIMASDEEKEAAQAMAADVEDLLRSEGFSYALTADSGSGEYQLYAIDLPNDEESKALLESFYAALSAALPSTGAKIDKSVFNASRILRIGGTTNRKGDGTPERPHRPCHYREPIEDCPVDVVPAEVIRAFVAKYAPPQTAHAKPNASNNGQQYDRLDVGRYLRHHGVTFSEKATGKGRAFLLKKCLFDDDHGARGESAVLQEADGKLSYKCMHDTCVSRRWADVRDKLGKPEDDHYDPPRQKVKQSGTLAQSGTAPPQQSHAKQKANGEPALPVPAKMITRSYEDIQVEQVSWLWEDRIALGKLSLVAGVPGVGKTFLLCDTAARCSRGDRFADGACAPQCETLILTAEDGPEDTIKPRLVAHEAVCARVHHYDKVDIGGKEAYFTLTGYLDVLDSWLADHPAVKLVVFDPITAFLGDGVDSHKNAEVRAALGPLCKLAEVRDVAIVGITHLSKGQAKAINRVIGSIAFVGAARACWLVDWDPEVDGRRLFLPIKNNLAHAEGLAYTITDRRIAWESAPVTITADDLSDSTHTTPRDEAEQWLRQALQDGRVSSAKLAAEAKREGISERTLKRAKKGLGVVSEKDGSAWYCRLPDETDTSGIAGQAGRQKFDFGEYTG